MTDNPAESIRFWRLNSLMALRENRESERDAIDPDHLAAIKANNTELAQLESQEKAVKTRHTRIFSKNRRNLQPPKA